MVVLEPSCCAVFRDELTGLFPHDQDAARLQNQTFTLSEFLGRHAPHYPSKQLDRMALVHFHCHHRAIMKEDAEKELLQRAGIRFEVPDEGCCGMAGAFGFEKGEPYDVSIKCGERKLLPGVRKAADDKLIIANGFSCHEQIVQQTSRQPLHIAEVLQMVKEFGKVPPAGAPDPGKTGSSSDPKFEGAGLVLGAGALLAGVGAYLLGRKPKDED
jgi:Fe-S oxidoreductase